MHAGTERVVVPLAATLPIRAILSRNNRHAGRLGHPTSALADKAELHPVGPEIPEHSSRPKGQHASTVPRFDFHGVEDRFGLGRSYEWIDISPTLGGRESGEA